MGSFIEIVAWIDPGQLLNEAMFAAEQELRKSVGELRNPTELSEQQIAHAGSCRNLVLDGLSRLSVLAPHEAEIEAGIGRITHVVGAHA